MTWGEDQLDKIKEGRDRAIAKRQRLIGQLKDRPKRPKISVQAELECAELPARRMAGLDVKSALLAADQLRFMRLDPSLDVPVGPAETLNRPTRALLSDFVATLQSGLSRAVLQWPFGQRDISILHPLAMIATISALKVVKLVQRCGIDCSFGRLSQAQIESWLVRYLFDTRTFGDELTAWDWICLARLSQMVLSDEYPSADGDIFQRIFKMRLSASATGLTGLDMRSFPKIARPALQFILTKGLAPRGGELLWYLIDGTTVHFGLPPVSSLIRHLLRKPY